MFPHSDWAIMAQRISLLIALTQIGVKIDSKSDIGRFPGQGIVVFCAVLKGDTVKRSSNPKS